MSTVYLNIGSNLSPRRRHIQLAINMLALAWPDAILRQTPYIESEPWGYSSEHNFLNMGVAFDFDSVPDPMEVLSVTQGVERAICRNPHRNADGSYHDRDVDIDIIAIDDIRLDTPQLQLPHPRASQRPFVTIPLRVLGYDLNLLTEFS